MGKESKKGHHFYRNMGLKLMSLYLPEDVLAQLRLMARRQDRSIQKVVRRIVVEYVRQHRSRKT